MNFRVVSGMLILILSTIILVASLASNLVIIPLEPKNNEKLTTQPEFRWFGNVNQIIIDDNINFQSPIVRTVKENTFILEKELEFSDYYWKLMGEVNSSVRKFTLQSLVAIKVKEKKSQ